MSTLIQKRRFYTTNPETSGDSELYFYIVEMIKGIRRNNIRLDSVVFPCIQLRLVTCTSGHEQSSCTKTITNEPVDGMVVAYALVAGLF